MDAFGRLLAAFKSGDRDFDLSGQCFALEHIWGEVGEIIPTDLFERDNRLAVVLGHQQKCCVHR